ncbi:MAG: nucleotidyltransferase domain-containing protein [Deltaproteobacteria bacterium]|nr:nucleotidyltransferase domain-containing protein [Deltaproteobacteria bacterium]
MGQALQSEDVIDRIVERLVDALHPMRIVLFGSRARGDARADSDYDFLVVADLPVGPAEREFLAHKAATGFGVSKDIVVVTPAEFRRLSNWSSSLVAAALREGRTVYEAA